jgi:hypothetical protein
MSIRVRHYIRGAVFAVLALALMLNLYLCYTVTMAMVALAVVAVGDFVNTHDQKERGGTHD